MILSGNPVVGCQVSGQEKVNLNTELQGIPDDVKNTPSIVYLRPSYKLIQEYIDSQESL